MQTIKVIKDKMTQSFGNRRYTGDHILYLCKNSEGEVIRIGATQNLNSRFNTYKNSGQEDPRIWEELKTVDYKKFQTRIELHVEEDKLIKQYQPMYNITQKVVKRRDL